MYTHSRHQRSLFPTIYYRRPRIERAIFQSDGDPKVDIRQAKSQDKCADIAVGSKVCAFFRGKSVHPDLLPQLSGGTYELIVHQGCIVAEIARCSMPQAVMSEPSGARCMVATHQHR